MPSSGAEIITSDIEGTTCRDRAQFPWTQVPAACRLTVSAPHRGRETWRLVETRSPRDTGSEDAGCLCRAEIWGLGRFVTQAPLVSPGLPARVQQPHHRGPHTGLNPSNRGLAIAARLVYPCSPGFPDWETHFRRSVRTTPTVSARSKGVGCSGRFPTQTPHRCPQVAGSAAAAIPVLCEL